MKLSDRIQRITESSTIAISARAASMKAAGIDVIDFSAGEPDFPTPENIKQKGVEAIQNNFTRYTPSAGIRKLREAVAQRYSQKYGVNISWEEVILTNGGKQALFNLMCCLVQEGDEVLIPEPYWVTFPDQVRLMGATPVFIPARAEDGFALHIDEVAGRITSRTAALILNSPCNPSGAVISHSSLSNLIDLCEERGIRLIYDECYDCFVFPPNRHSSPIEFFPRGRDLTFVVNTFSKVYSMTGWRLGFGIGPREVIAACDRLQSHTTSNPSSISQMAALEALQGDQDSVRMMFEEYLERRRIVMGALKAMPGIRCNEPQGAFYVFPDIRDHLTKQAPDSVSFCRALLEECHVATFRDRLSAWKGAFAFLTRHPGRKSARDAVAFTIS
jgi:aspartate aminotransferase